MSVVGDPGSTSENTQVSGPQSLIRRRVLDARVAPDWYTGAGSAGQLSPWTSIAVCAVLASIVYLYAATVSHSKPRAFELTPLSEAPLELSRCRDVLGRRTVYARFVVPDDLGTNWHQQRVSVSPSMESMTDAVQVDPLCLVRSSDGAMVFIAFAQNTDEMRWVWVYCTRNLLEWVILGR